jgi:hypothetical protein
MDQIESKEVKRNKAIRVITLALLVFGLITAPASAGYTFTGNLSDIGQVITDFLSLQDEILQLVIFGVVMAAAGAIGGFITGFFSVI